ncbi:PF05114 family protein [Leptospira inadai serovar Lyme str. 10]|uniref:PF05114 family protein n=2 Tax=Leptospira inadai serovar Lyme TaxID=293084 RepID=V6H904_9LEPT|nr:DUF692 domain-containing protein [Leptospira inadai]EQA35332.1 PF05114 family protein [Leptospira inadai serovar Lyme str. 10]PNV74571.1 DUF692 domain-containing protein [Leptospira inadai serovar Lyme]
MPNLKNKNESLGALGIGVGLRSEHYPYLREKKPVRISWFEAITENYMDSEGKPFAMLEEVRKDFPVALHGVSLSLLGGSFPNPRYMSKWKSLIERIDPAIVSDHLCWTDHDGQYLHDLLPFPFTAGFQKLAVERIGKIQEFLGRRILIENVSTYVRFRSDEMTEWEFLSGVLKESGCGLLLDLNNVYVNSFNHGFSANEFLEKIPWDSVGQIHIAGFTDTGDFLFDTHSKPVSKAVWDLMAAYAKKIEGIPILLEWDADIPSFPELEIEALRAAEFLSIGTI